MNGTELDYYTWAMLIHKAKENKMTEQKARAHQANVKYLGHGIAVLRAHETDADCTPHLDDTDTCTKCGAQHGDPCPDCSGRGYHTPTCFLLSPDAYKVARTEVKEIEQRLLDHLDDFAGGNVTAYEDEGIDGRGMVLRIVCGDRMIEVDVSIKDVTEDLDGAA